VPRTSLLGQPLHGWDVPDLLAWSRRIDAANPWNSKRKCEPAPDRCGACLNTGTGRTESNRSEPSRHGLFVQ
jgi:hypothetical protein